MSRVIANMSVSLDGFVADTDERVEEVFAWMSSGPVETVTANPGVTLHTSAVDAEFLRSAFAEVGALVTGRHLFDFAQGWGGRHPLGVPVFVVTHRPPPADWVDGADPFEFVTEGAEAAVGRASQVAGSRAVAIASTTITQQCLALGLLDELHVDLVPVLLGSGVRWFDTLPAPVRLSSPTVTEGDGVTHLQYRIRQPHTPEES